MNTLTFNLTDEEGALITKFREEKTARKKQVISDIAQIIGSECRSEVNSWSNWPGTMHFAQAIFHMLESTGRIKV